MNKPRLWPVFVTFVVAVLAAQVAAMLVMVIHFGRRLREAEPDAHVQIVGGLVTYAILLALTLLTARPLTRARLGLVPGRARPLDALIATVGLIALGTVIDSVGMLAGVYEGSALGQFKRMIEGATRPQLGALLFSLCLLPGLCEELFFRGLVQTRLAQRWRPITAVVVTSACFGLWHLDPFQSTEAFFLGLGLGYVAVRTGSIWPGIVAHVVNNAANVLFQALGLVSAALLPNLAWGAVGLVLFVLCLMAFRRRPPLPAAEPVAVSAVQ